MSRFRRARRRLALLAVVLALAACGRKPKVLAAGAASPGAEETGIASWYGHPYHGRAAANGEIYDMEKMTAAHRTLPFDTWVRVESLASRKTVEVRITDRGPFVEGRIIDLSRSAARALDMIGPGTAPVRLRVIRAPEAQPDDDFAVQVGSFLDKARAARLREEMEQRWGSARVMERPGNPAMWRVLVGRERTTDAANGLAARIRQEGSPAFVVRVDRAVR